MAISSLFGSLVPARTVFLYHIYILLKSSDCFSKVECCHLQVCNSRETPVSELNFTFVYKVVWHFDQSEPGGKEVKLESGV